MFIIYLYYYFHYIYIDLGQWLAGAATVATPVSGMDAEIFGTILKVL
jgi:hypothetical protein